MHHRRRRIEAKKAHLLRRVAAVRAARAPAGRRLPTSGGEEEFTNVTYGSPEGIADNNCYGFAMDWYRDSGGEKLQPGELSKTARDDDDLTRCPVLGARVASDLRTKTNGGYPLTDPSAKCRPGYYKIMSFVDPGKDFHWYRQMGDMVLTAPGDRTVAQLASDMGVDPSQIDAPSDRPAKGERFVVWDAGLWAHKRGLDELATKDASGRYILDPRDADRKYGRPPNGLNYTTFCGAYCINDAFGKGTHAR